MNFIERFKQGLSKVIWKFSTPLIIWGVKKFNIPISFQDYYSCLHSIRRTKIDWYFSIVDKKIHLKAVGVIGVLFCLMSLGFQQQEESWIMGFLLNLGTGFISSVVIIFLYENMMERCDRINLKKKKKIVLNDIVLSIMGLYFVLFTIAKAIDNVNFKALIMDEKIDEAILHISTPEFRNEIKQVSNYSLENDKIQYFEKYGNTVEKIVIFLLSETGKEAENLYEKFFILLDSECLEILRSLRMLSFFYSRREVDRIYERMPDCISKMKNILLYYVKNNKEDLTFISPVFHDLGQDFKQLYYSCFYDIYNDTKIIKPKVTGNTL